MMGTGNTKTSCKMLMARVLVMSCLNWGWEKNFLNQYSPAQLPVRMLSPMWYF